MNDETPARTIRRLMRSLDMVALGTLHCRQQAAPYVSLAMVALDQDGSPLLLLSDLADHARNIAADDRVSLLFDGTGAAEVPLAAARASVQGRATPVEDDRARARYLARHPDARLYAGFKDFRLYRVSVERAHLVAGFGRITWVDGAALLPAGVPEALVAAEEEIVAHMNEEHHDAVQLCARLAGRAGEGWRMTGIDPEGLDLRRGRDVARAEFDRPVSDAQSARAELVRLVRRVRRETEERNGGMDAAQPRG
ncbi:HugZ family pyridoxamine 5'-phosphate oxidase [Marinimicrococcus flavescens]|uniref:DUF2470 domain-containing protein n=1 Tax=Marinimicrococcus flavescens TaxID=3031815 RepID=A0AAP3XSB6_9PROT|nr:DUF2470 domain-containing protein [Marinimicrococcus flavescens]